MFIICMCHSINKKEIAHSYNLNYTDTSNKYIEYTLLILFGKFIYP